MLNALSIDLEEWFCVSNFEHVIHRSEWADLESRVEDATDQILELFRRHDVQATFFLLGWVAERHPDLIRRIAEAGHELASHGYAHQLVYDLQPEEFRQDLERSLEVVHGITGITCRGYRAPSFSIRRDMHWAWEALAGLGFEYDSSIFPVLHDRYGEPDAPRFPFTLRSGDVELIEFPLTTVQMFSRNMPVAGGGYFRLYPLTVTRRAIRGLNRQGRPAVIYLHPWEFDPGHPKPGNVSALKLMRHRVGLDSVMKKLDSVLGEFKFGTMAQVLRQVEVSPAQVQAAPSMSTT